MLSLVPRLRLRRACQVQASPAPKPSARLHLCPQPTAHHLSAPRLPRFSRHHLQQHKQARCLPCRGHPAILLHMYHHFDIAACSPATSLSDSSHAAPICSRQDPAQSHTTLDYTPLSTKEPTHPARQQFQRNTCWPSCQFSCQLLPSVIIIAHPLGHANNSLLGST